MEIYFGEIERAYSHIARERALLDLKTLISDTEALLKATAQDAREEIKEIRTRLTAALEQARITCTQLQQQGATAGRAVVKRADTVIREHPYASVAVALGVGLLIGVLAMWGSPRSCEAQPD